MKPPCDFDTWWHNFRTNVEYDEKQLPSDLAAEAFKAGWEWANEVGEW